MRLSVVDKRIPLLALLGAVALALAAAIFLTDQPMRSDEAVGDRQRIHAILQDLFKQYHIDAASVRTRKIGSASGRFTREETRVVVPLNFNTLNFNHDLSEKLRAFGLRAAASEKAEDKSVTIHIKQSNLIIESLVFQLREER